MLYFWKFFAVADTVLCPVAPVTLPKISVHLVTEHKPCIKCLANIAQYHPWRTLWARSHRSQMWKLRCRTGWTLNTKKKNKNLKKWSKKGEEKENRKEEKKGGVKRGRRKKSDLARSEEQNACPGRSAWLTRPCSLHHQASRHFLMSHRKIRHIK